jgi:hypothetical protein
MRTLLKLFKVAPRWDRQVMAITTAASVFLLVVGAAMELMAA